STLRDFYWRYSRGIEPYDSSVYQIEIPARQGEPLSADEKEKYANRSMYELTFSNKGGLVMPIIIEWTYKDGTKEIDRLPAQVWRHNENTVVKTFVKEKEVSAIQLDPLRETSDINTTNNSWNITTPPSRFTIFKQKAAAARGQSQGINPMQKAKEKKGF
ncbi:MAG: M1 family peptidase, partial [Chitinophagaceae bacterium]